MANAELSTKEAWDNLKKLLETGGYQVIGQENSVGSDLSIKNVQISFEVDEQTNINFDIGSLNLTKNKNGFINITLPEEIYVQYINEDEFGYKTEANILVRALDLDFKVSGKLSQVLYQLKASSAGFALIELLDNGVASPDLSAEMEFVLADVNSTIRVVGVSTIEVTSLLSASGASLKGGFSVLSVPLKLNFQYVMDQLKSSNVSNEPKASLDEDFELALAKGFSSTSNFTFDTSEMNLSATTPSGPLAISFTTGPSSLTSALSQSAFLFSRITNSLNLT